MQAEEIIVRSLRRLDALVAEKLMGIKPPSRSDVNFTPAKYTTGPHWRNRYKEEAPATGMIVGKESFYEGKTVRWLVKVDNPDLAARYTDGIMAFFPTELTEL
jgi:hypothetical protein